MPALPPHIQQRLAAAGPEAVTAALAAAPQLLRGGGGVAVSTANAAEAATHFSVGDRYGTTDTGGGAARAAITSPGCSQSRSTSDSMLEAAPSPAQSNECYGLQPQRPSPEPPLLYGCAALRECPAAVVVCSRFQGVQYRGRGLRV